MALSSGTRLGPYEILSPLGAGGMGEVYRARDARLERAVAVKVLPPALSSDPQFRERFDREARVISQLEHPHICPLYDVGVQDGTAYLVMQLLDGETLAARLERGAVPSSQALEYAVQIADAVALAHRSGVIHRDLKPANVMITASGVRLLDFGLAAARQHDRGSALNVSVQTMSARLTAQGTIMGTFEYMAPEQIEGGEIDTRADIWAFGCVLYEMLTGVRPFAGKSSASVIANILAAEPRRLRERQPLAPESLDHVVHRCLQKNPDDRWQSIADVGHALRWAAAYRPSAPEVSPPFWKRPLGYAAAVALVAATAIATFFATRSGPDATRQEPVRRLLFQPQDGIRLTAFGSYGNPHFALSPDGERIAFVGSTAGQPPALWVQRLDSRLAQLIPQSDDASAPFWAPDGTWIGFFAEGRLKTARIDGDRPSASLMVLDAAGGTTNGEVILIGRGTGPVLSIPVNGTTPRDVTTIEGRAQGHRWPQFLPDSRRFIFTDRRGAVRIASLDGPQSAPLLDTPLTALFTHPDVLLYPTSAGMSRLMAQQFEYQTGRLTGQPRAIVEKLGFAAGSGYPTFSTSSNGLLAYWDGTTVSTVYSWFDRRGNQLATLPVPGDGRAAAISPDGSRIAFSQRRGDAAVDVWLMEAVTGASTRFSFSPQGGVRPIWVNEGRDLFFSSLEGEEVLLVRRPASGTEKERVIARLPVPSGVPGLGNYYATDWSKDGRWALVSVSAPTSARDIAVFDASTGTFAPLLNGLGFEVQARFAPDTKWFAYASNETGRWEVFVEPFPANGQRSQVSSDGGSQPVWGRDGRELFFVAPDGQLMMVSVGTGPTFTHQPPQVLFQTGMRPTYAPYPTTYDVSPDGQRFLLDIMRPETGPTISIVTNWVSGTVR